MDDIVKRGLAARKVISNAVNMKNKVNRRRKSGEIANRKLSIQNFCRECMGWDKGDCSSLSENIRECTAPECWLYPWRNGKLDMGS